MTDKRLPAARARAIDAAVARLMKQERLPGVLLTLSGPAGTYAKAYGTSDLKRGAPSALGQHFRIGSITKTFTATAVLQLVDQGKVKLSDRVAKYVGGVVNGGEMTVGQLLGMRGGTFDYTHDEQFGSALDANPLLPFGPRDVMRILRRHEPNFAPGTNIAYSDSDYVLLGMILEKVTGRPPGVAIKRQIIDELGLRNTSYPTGARLPSPFLHGHWAGDDGKRKIVERTALNPEIAGTSGGMISTVGDLEIWGEALATGRLLSKATHAEQLTLAPIAHGHGLTARYGLGVIGIGRWLGHNGEIPGYSAVVMHDPKTGATFSFGTNLSSSTAALGAFTAVVGPLYPGSLD